MFGTLEFLSIFTLVVSASAKVIEHNWEAHWI